MWGSTRLVTHQTNTVVSRHADLASDLVNPAPTFVYNATTGRLESVTKPETGTTTYAYNTDGTVLHTIDAKNQKTEFTYDSLKRVTAIKRFVNSSGVWVEQPCQEVSYAYDANPDTGATYNLRGRLARVVAKQCDSVITSYSEYFEYETSGLLQHRDSVWKRYNYAAYTLTRRVDPTFNQLGLLTNFGYGATGSLYSYAYTYDNAWRPATMTGESLTLVNGVTYNAAGAMTAFTRNDGSGTAVNNSYTFNHLYQLTNQTVTKGGATLQNLTYNFSSTQNNGQILSQIDAVSGETVEYAYDSLNRLLTAATTGPQWGLSFTYDGFGNRTNQSVTKGSGPTHSVAIDPATNRISTSGYTYDNNGNMTQMPQLTMSYDVANRMTTANHASAGTQSYGYNHANQRVFVRNGNTVTYYLYGLGGERLMEFQETCTSGACTSYTETQRWIYFAGRKMFSKTGTTLKAITPNRLASEAKHFPYGETDGTPPSDTKDYFATYRRDGTGLDYAWNRYYSPTMGRFTTADPYGGSARLMIPESWNRYAYLSSNPLSANDPTGLSECKDEWGTPCFSVASRLRPDARSGGGVLGGAGALANDEKTIEQMNVEAQAAIDSAKGAHVVQAKTAQQVIEDLAAASNVLSVLGLIDIPVPCRNSIDALSTASGGAVNAATISDANSRLIIEDGTKATMQYNDLFRNSENYVPNMLPGFTVADYFAKNRGVNAVTVLGADNLGLARVFVRPWSIIGRSGPEMAGFVMHELLHSLGMEDPQIKAALGIGAKSPSREITVRLANNCFGAGLKEER